MNVTTRICAMMIAFLTAVAFGQAGAPGGTARVISFRSENISLSAYIFKPDGAGPFPVIIWNHGSPKPLLDSGSASRFDNMAKLFTSHGYLIMIPDRRVRNPVYRDGRLDAAADQEVLSAALKNSTEELETNHRDLDAAIQWIKKQPYADKTKIIMSGYSNGAIQAAYEAGRGSELRAFVLFTPGSTQWHNSPFLQKMLIQSVRTSKAPCMLIQAQNDYGLDASVRIGRELSAKPKPNNAMVYPPHGASQREANLFVLTGCSIYGDDVLQFLDEALKN